MPRCSRISARPNRAGTGLRTGLGQSRGCATDQADRARRHDRGRCLSVASAAALCRSHRGGFARRNRPALHAIEWRSRRGDSISRQGRDAIGPRGWCRWNGRRDQIARQRAIDWVRHGRNVDRRVALCRTVRACRRKRGRRGPHPCADDVNPYGNSRRWFDCRFDGMRFRVGQRARAQIRDRPATQRRAADGYGLQPPPRLHRSGTVPRRFWARRRSAARSSRIEGSTG